MRRFTPLLVLPLLLSSTAFARTSAEHWAWTGLSTNDALRMSFGEGVGIFDDKNCYSDFDHYRGCVGAVNAVASMADPAMQLLPSSVARDFGKVVKNYGGLSLVEITAVEETKVGDTQRAVLARRAERRNKITEALRPQFRAARLRQNFFATLFTETVKESIKDQSLDPMAAGMALSAYLSALDAHARLQPADEFAERSGGTGESFAGIGAMLGKVNGKLVVANVIENSPAEAAGLRDNDILLAIDGTSLEGKEIDDAVKLIRGEAGSLVILSISRKGAPTTLSVVRGQVQSKNVQARVVEDLGAKIGVLKINSFVDDTLCDTLAAKITDLEQKGVTGLVVDVRGNPGGLIDQAVCVGGLFVGKKVIVKVRDLNAQLPRPYLSAQNQVTRLPVAVLIDGGSASASELVAGALRDHNRAWNVGERSFGKGTVQQSNPSEGKQVLAWTNLLRLRRLLKFETIQRFYQPGGTTNQMVGIGADFEVPARPNMTEDERFVRREADIFPNGLVAEGKEWKPSAAREAAAKAVRECMAKEGKALRAYEQKTAADEIADYQLLAAQEVLGCSK